MLGLPGTGTPGAGAAGATPCGPPRPAAGTPMTTWGRGEPAAGAGGLGAAIRPRPGWMVGGTGRMLEFGMMSLKGMLVRRGVAGPSGRTCGTAGAE